MADHLGLYCLIGCLTQLVFCFLKQKLWIRCLPMLAVVGCMAASMLNFFSGGEVYSLLYYVGWGAVLLSALSAWLIYAVIHFCGAGKEK